MQQAIRLLGHLGQVDNEDGGPWDGLGTCDVVKNEQGTDL